MTAASGNANLEANVKGIVVQDVLIAGGGIGGLTLALALRETFGETFRVAVADPAFGARDASVRASALTAGSRHLLEAIGIWPQLADRAQPMLGMKITDSRRNDAVRPLFLDIDQPLANGEPFAFMIQNRDLLGLLEAQVSARGVTLLPAAVSRIVTGERGVDIRLADASQHHARLLVGADGVQSRVRRVSGIATINHDYRRSAIVATLAHEEEHHGIAVQHFLPAGPFAMLPLCGRRSSIVWTERRDDAAAMLQLSDEDFLAEVERRFGYGLGRFTMEDRPAAFPLRVHLARRFIAPRTALIGDAAHLVHPLAGQGLNLGYRDIAALVSSLAKPVRLGLDPGDEDGLADYQRARFFDTASMVAATHGLHRLFSNDIAPVRLLRDIGLGLVNRLPRLKRSFVREAAGISGDVPALLRGRLP